MKKGNVSTHAFYFNGAYSEVGLNPLTIGDDISVSFFLRVHVITAYPKIFETVFNTSNLV